MFLIIFGLIQLLVAMFGFASVLKMRRNKILTGGFIPSRVSQGECSDVDAVIHDLTRPQMFFSFICLLCGLVDIFDGQYGMFDDWLVMIIAIVFLVITYRFCGTVRKISRKYFTEVKN